MSRFFEIILFGIVAVGVHVAGFYSIPAKGIQAGGSQGTEAVSIHSASQRIETMVEEWEEPPSVDTKIAMQAKVSTNADKTPKFSVPNNLTATVILPSVKSLVLPDVEQSPEVQTETAKAQKIQNLNYGRRKSLFNKRVKQRKQLQSLKKNRKPRMAQTVKKQRVMDPVLLRDQAMLK